MSGFRNRLLKSAIGSNILPQGYYLCEYIESDGTNYIDTGFKHNQDTRVVMDIEAIGITANAWAFEGRDTTGSGGHGVFFYHSSTSLWTADNGGSSNRMSFDGIGATDRLSIDFNKNVCTINGVENTFTEKTFQSSYNLTLFAANTTGTVAGFLKAKLYSCKIYDNDALIRDYIPCVNPQGYFGLYDLVNGEFYGFKQLISAASYSIDLNSAWRKSSTIANPDSSLYDGVYESYSNYNVGSSTATCIITIKGYTEFAIYIRSYAESNYDYLTAYALDSNNDVMASTGGNQQSGTGISSYTKVNYTGIDGGTHTIRVMYSKDSSVNSNDDRGYLLIAKTGSGESSLEDVIGNGKVILPDGYTWTEHIYSDGNAYIDTLFAPTSDTRVRMKCTTETGTASVNRWILGSNTSASEGRFEVINITSDNSIRFYFNTSNTTFSGVGLGSMMIDVSQSDANINNVSVTPESGTFEGTNTLLIGAGQTTGEVYAGIPMYINFFQILGTGDTLTKLFIACINSEGVYGMYDVVGGVFYESSGSSAFIKDVLVKVRIMDTNGIQYTADEYDSSISVAGLVLYCPECDPFVFKFYSLGALLAAASKKIVNNGATHYDEADAVVDYYGYTNTNAIVDWLELQSISLYDGSAVYLSVNDSTYNSLYSSGILRRKPYLTSLGQLVLINKYIDKIKECADKVYSSTNYWLPNDVVWSSTNKQFCMGASENWNEMWVANPTTGEVAVVNFYDTYSVYYMFYICGDLPLT